MPRVLLLLLGSSFMLLGGGVFPLRAATFTLATFQADITIPMGHPCMGGGISPAKEVVDPLLAKGFVLMGGERPIVLVSLDWCEVRGTSYDKWKTGLAQAAGTDASHVLVTATHVHDAPVMDEDAEKILRDTEATGAWKDIPPPDRQAPVLVASVCWPKFNDECVAKVATALRESLRHPQPVTHWLATQARVDRVASNRRFVRPNGSVSYSRMSRCTDPEAIAADEGIIDPSLHTLSFFGEGGCLCDLHCYAVHPMSSYGAGKVSWDFVGDAREKMQKEHPKTFQIFANGCAGNVVAGKYNNGDSASRGILAARLKAAMEEASGDHKDRRSNARPLQKVGWNMALLPLKARNTPGHTEPALRTRVAQGVRPFDRSEAAMGLAWYERVQQGHQIEVPVIDFGSAQLMLLPAESYVEYQLYAQTLRDHPVIVLGYGECGPGYIPVERAWREKDSNLHGWTWVGPGSEDIMNRAIREALGVGD